VLGPSWDGQGTTFAVRSDPAERVEVCVLGRDGREERHADLARGSGGVWSGHLDGTGPGDAYGFRAHGPWDPARGRRCNPAQLLVDPYAHAVAGALSLHPAIFAHDVDDPGQPSRLDSAPYVPHALVVDDAFDWGADRAPHVPWADTVVYEAHVRGLTRKHPAVPEELRGTYRGLAHHAVLEHLTNLGVTTVELLPVHAFAPEVHLLRKGMPNYWGYSSLAFLAPHGAYATAGGDAVREFKEMVRDLHAAGLEVVLDVVYNHTCEGGSDGPSLSLRGLDEAAYYRMRGGRHVDHTGCGNTVDLRNRHARRVVLDSLRYWVEVMHVDGFRFDLAPALGRESDQFHPDATFLSELGADPVLSQVKLIAEPWDVGPDGWQTGNFPAPWAEWNDRFRDDVRDYWRGSSHGIGAVASRLMGSRDVFGSRAPLASVNFVTAHDGFTARDLVSYNAKHNEANGEQGRDGTSDNRSWNHGVEGETDDPEVLADRRQTLRGLLATLLLSRGVPMLTAGDEMGRTQGGNNNAYCQDAPVSWVHWQLAPWQEDLLATVRRMLALRRAHAALCAAPTDARWLRPDGCDMTERDWRDPALRTVLVRLPCAEDVVVLVLHGGAEPTYVTLPGADRAYDLQLDTTWQCPPTGSAYRFGPGSRMELAPRSVVVLTAAP
jgi:isoamylase